ncbi:TDP-N-acetylfucosamine:lipid II N-acetylfucosaminyltransferase [Rheinheimera nanhaiensis]|nr:TDP-N-acetylfucosamine:lipid II N-acetylfucosaminyltransferase [Rheinheimera nanhaiensis]
MSDFFRFSFYRELRNFDLIVFHSLSIFLYPIILFSSKKTKLAWLGWGFDYYDYISDNKKNFILPATLKIKDLIHQSLQSEKADYSPFKKIIKAVYLMFFEKKAISKFNSFSPVLHSEYQLIEQLKLMHHVPDFCQWNYGSLEDFHAKNILGKTVTGNAILIGNSATYTNNHIEAFETISTSLSRINAVRDVYVPLSYGDESYKDYVVDYGRDFFKHAFKPVLEFMPLDEYSTLLMNCGFVVMNHIRQQALGNIIMMVYLGARVFLREDNPLYDYFVGIGAVVNKISDLESHPELLSTPLTEADIKANKKALYTHWSRAVIDSNTEKLVRYHVGPRAD